MSQDERAITEVRVYRVPLETRTAYTMSSSDVATPTSTVVEILDGDGRAGYGESCLANAHYQPEHNAGVRTALEVIGPAILGLDPLHTVAVNAAMDRAMAGHHEAKAALDLACWDLAGKQHDRSVVDLLGGARVDSVPTYHVIGISAATDAAASAIALQEQGLRRLQLKAGGRPIHEDIDAIRAVAAVLQPGTDLAVDANRGWTTVEAIQVSLACADLVMSLEQPCATEAELHELKTRIRHPIVVDESATDLRTIARLISAGVADGFGLKITRLGGLTTMRAVRDLCMAARVPMSCDDAWGGDIIAAAGVALAATLDPALNRGAWIAHPYHQTHYDAIHGPRIDDGRVKCPNGGPGLGLVLDHAEFGEPVARHRR